MSTKYRGGVIFNSIEKSEYLQNLFLLVFYSMSVSHFLETSKRAASASLCPGALKAEPVRTEQPAKSVKLQAVALVALASRFWVFPMLRNQSQKFQWPKGSNRSSWISNHGENGIGERQISAPTGQKVQWAASPRSERLGFGMIWGCCVTSVLKV